MVHFFYHMKIDSERVLIIKCIAKRVNAALFGVINKTK